MFREGDPLYIIFCRVFLAVVFMLSGISGFVDLGLSKVFLIDGTIVGGLATSPHFFTLKAIEVVIGVCFLGNFLIQTVLLFAAPIIVCAIGYHFWAGTGYGAISLLLLAPLALLFPFYRDTYKVFFMPQLYAGTWSEESARVIVFDEVKEKKPNLVASFEEIYTQIKSKKA